MFTHFNLGFLKDRALLGHSQPCGAGTCSLLNIGVKYSWVWLAGDCLGEEALDNSVSGIKSLENARAQAAGEWTPSGFIHDSG